MPPSVDPFIPYGRQLLTEDDLEGVAAVLRGDFLTTGPFVEQFETDMARRLDVKHGVAVCNGTAALHLSLLAAGVVHGDEVIVPAMTFASTASTVLMCGATPVVVDVSAETGLIDTKAVLAAVTDRTRAVVAVDYTGVPCDYDALHRVLSSRRIPIISDACHSLGAAYHQKKVGNLALMTALSFHPVKHITTGEGGMVMTHDDAAAKQLRLLRNHGINRDHHARRNRRTWEYDITTLGYNYRLTDIQSALGISQLKKLDRFVARRREIAKRYDAFFDRIPGIDPLVIPKACASAYHLYVVRVDPERITGGRNALYARLFELRIGTNVHYKPIHHLTALAPRLRLGSKGCQMAEHLFERILSLPIYPAMTDADLGRVLTAITHALQTSRSSAVRKSETHASS